MRSLHINLSAAVEEGNVNTNYNNSIRAQLTSMTVKNLKLCFGFLTSRTTQFNCLQQMVVSFPLCRKQEFVEFFVCLYSAADRSLYRLALDILLKSPIERIPATEDDVGESDWDHQEVILFVDDEQTSADSIAHQTSSPNSNVSDGALVLANFQSLSVLSTNPSKDCKIKAQRKVDEALFSLPHISDDRDFQTVETMASETYNWQNLRLEWLLVSETSCKSITSTHVKYTSIIQALGYYLNLKTVVLPAQVGCCFYELFGFITYLLPCLFIRKLKLLCRERRNHQSQEKKLRSR